MKSMFFIAGFSFLVLSGCDYRSGTLDGSLDVCPPSELIPNIRCGVLGKPGPGPDGGAGPSGGSDR